jgi:hypothetical protein
MPVYAREPDNVFQPFQFPHNQRPVRPRACIRDIEMISIFLGRKLGARFVLDEVSKDRRLTLEFARLVAWCHPVEDVVVFLVRL